MKYSSRSVLVLVAFLTLTVFGSAQGNLGGGRLAGTWDAEIKIFNCVTGVEITSFQSTANFNSGGTFTGITSGMPPAARTPEIGIWRHETGNIYNFKFKAYQFNPAGTPVLYQVVNHTLEIASDGQAYVSEGGVKFFTMDGIQTGAGCSSGIGTRMTFD